MPLPELTKAEAAAIREDEAAIVRDAETSIVQIKAEIFDAERLLHDTLGHASDGLSKQTRAKIAQLKADLIESEAILEAVQDKVGE